MNKTRRFSFLSLTASLLLIAVGVWAQAEDKQTLRIAGSNTFGEELGPRLIAAFESANPDVHIELGTEGTGSGMAALFNGTCDVAAASRVANEDELRMARARKVQLVSHFIGSYGVAVIVHADNPVRGLSDRQIRNLFTGATTNWEKVGGRNAPVHLYIRDPISGTYLGFRELAMEDKPYTDKAVTKTSYRDIVDAVRNDPNGIGYIGMNLAQDTGVKAVLVNGIPANYLSINEGMYPYARGLRFYTIRGQESAVARAWIRFVRGRDGQSIVGHEGFVPRFMPRMTPSSMSL